METVETVPGYSTLQPGSQRSKMIQKAQKNYNAYSGRYYSNKGAKSNAQELQASSNSLINQFEQRAHYKDESFKGRHHYLDHSLDSGLNQRGIIKSLSQMPLANTLLDEKQRNRSMEGLQVHALISPISKTMTDR